MSNNKHSTDNAIRLIRGLRKLGFGVASWAHSREQLTQDGFELKIAKQIADLEVTGSESESKLIAEHLFKLAYALDDDTLNYHKDTIGRDNIQSLEELLQPPLESAFKEASNIDCATAAILYALDDEDGMDFLRYWNEGDFQTIRNNWPDAPEEVFIGADPLHVSIKD